MVFVFSRMRGPLRSGLFADTSRAGAFDGADGCLHWTHGTVGDRILWRANVARWGSAVDCEAHTKMMRRLPNQPVDGPVRKPSRKLLTGVATVAGIVLVATFMEAPPRSLPEDERIPDRIVIRQVPKLGGRELVTLTNREDVLRVMTALPGRYTGPYCACFGYHNLEFYAPTGIYRTVNYKPGEYLRDSEHRTGQASVPRRFRRSVGGMIAQRESTDTGLGKGHQ